MKSRISDKEIALKIHEATNNLNDLIRRATCDNNLVVDISIDDAEYSYFDVNEEYFGGKYKDVSIKVKKEIQA
jgi:hypothetical protein